MDAHVIGARVARQMGAFDRAAVALDAATTASKVYPYGMGAAGLERAWLARSEGNRADAEMLAHQAVQILVGAGAAALVAACLELLGSLAVEAGSALEGTRLLGAAEALRDARWIVLFAIDLPDHEAAVTACRTALGDTDFEAAWEAGRRMSLEEAVAYAERGRGERKRPAAGWEALTPSEVDVVRLAAQGLSNPQIAERLFVSRHTVKVHLSHVFAKLGLASRSELAAEATRRGV
jgi:DNA-binding CsgD family transcriptional regulator